MSGYNLPLFTYSSIVTQLLLIVKSRRMDLSHLLSILYHSQPQPKTLLTNVQFWGVSAGHISLSMSLLHWDGASPHSHNLGHQEETKNWGLLISDRAVYLNKSLLRSNICLEPHLSLLRSLLPIRARSHLPENLRGFLTAWTKLGQTYLIFYVGVSLEVVLIDQKYTFMF